jgi:hypothetical protein
MSDYLTGDLADIIRATPEEAFREPRNPLENMSALERLRWLQQTAYFIWKHKGVVRTRRKETPR